jgi:hypothetical protein
MSVPYILLDNKACLVEKLFSKQERINYTETVSLVAKMNSA